MQGDTPKNGQVRPSALSTDAATDAHHPDPPAGRSKLVSVVRDAAVVVAAATVLALGSNALRRNGVPLVADKPYETLVPCPEPSGNIGALEASDSRVRDGHSLLVDARPAAEYQKWHFEGAVNAPFDWLAEMVEIRPTVRVLAQQVARSGRRRVIVYGDGGDPDTGFEWAKLLAAEGIKNVYCVAGGAPALQGKATSTEVGRSGRGAP